MVMMPFFKVTVAGQTPGDLIEIRSSESGRLAASGDVDAGGDFTAQFPASVGPITASTRRILGAVPWIDDMEVAPGQILTSPNFGGKLLQCRIGGTTSATEPTEADRIPYEYYSRMFNSRYNAGVIYRKNDAYEYRAYYTTTYDDAKFDNWITGWPLERVVEMVATQDGSYGLLDDGSVRYTSRNSTSTSGGAYWGYQALIAMPKVIKLWEYQYGIVALGADGQLYAASERYGTIDRYANQLLIDANPTAVYFCGGGNHEDMSTFILADGTIISADAVLAAETAFITDAAIGKVNHGSNGNFNWIFVSKDGQRIYVKHKTAIETYTGHINPAIPGDRVAKISCGYGIIYFQMESGRCGRWWGHAGVASIKHGGQLGSYMSGKPTEIQLYLNQWGYNANLETDYLITPKGLVNLTVASGWSSGLTIGMDPANGDEILIDGNPILQNGDATFAIINAPAENLIRHSCITVETIEVEGTGGSNGEISGTLNIDSSPAARDLVAISASKQGSERTVVGHATSDAVTGDYTMPLPGFIDPVMVIALDESGTPWLPIASVAHGQRMYPNDAAHTGLVYEAQGNGITGASEPTWPATVGDPVVDGTVNWTAADHYRGQVHGPVIPATEGEAGDNPPISWEGDIYLWAGLLELDGVIFIRYRKSTDQAVKLYRPVSIPADILENLYIYEYEQTIVGAYNYNIFTNTTDSEDHLYKTLDDGDGSAWLPIPMVLPTDNFMAGEIAQYYTVTDPGWVDGSRYSTTEGQINSHYSYAGSSDADTSMYGRFPLESGSFLIQDPDDMAGFALELWWWQMSYGGADQASLEIRFLDASSAVLGAAYASPLYAPPTGLVWEKQTFTTGEIPAGATQIELTWVGHRTSGTANNAYVDQYGANLVAI